MDLLDISNIRGHNQHIKQTNCISAKELIHSLGAMQAQDFIMSKWAVGLRLQHSTEETVEATYNNGEIIRTHLMRPTWHLVSANDIYWLLELTAPRIKPLLKTRNIQLELTENIFSKCNNIMEKELVNNTHLTREALTQLFENADIRTNDNRLSHILMNAELNGLICSGSLKNSKLTYALLSDRVPTKNQLTKEESLNELAKRYFTSHGPATLLDFVWWSGLSVSDAKKALEMNKSNLLCETVESETYWFGNSFSGSKNSQSVHLLPAFDELLISYRNRTAIINNEHHKKAISSNGIFRPIVVINNQVAGIWRRVTKNKFTIIEVNLFQRQDMGSIESIENEASRYGAFINRPIQLVINND